MTPTPCTWAVQAIWGTGLGIFAIQNSDLVLSIGSRLSIRQVGYNFETWARELMVIVNDIDEEELKKPSVHSDMRVHADAKDLLEQLDLVLDRVLAEEEGNLPESVSRPGSRQVFDGGKGLRDMTWKQNLRHVEGEISCYTAQALCPYG